MRQAPTSRRRGFPLFRVQVFAYDNEGNVTAKPQITGNDSVEYTWDRRNRLVKVTFKTSGTATKIVEYSYDFGARMVERSVDTDADLTDDERRIFAHDAGQVALHFEDTSSAGLTGIDLVRRYLWNPQGVDSLLADEQYDGTQTADDVLWPLADHLSTTRDVAQYNPTTDTTSIVNHITYNAFGVVVSETSTLATNDTLFHHTGKILDEHTALQWHDHRWLNTATATWQSADPIGFAAGDANLYRYVGNNAVCLIDPSGQMPREMHALIIVEQYVSRAYGCGGWGTQWHSGRNRCWTVEQPSGWKRRPE